MRQTLFILDGIRAGTNREVRRDTSTMGTMRLGDRPPFTWLLYDNRGGNRIDCIGLKESGFVATPQGIVHGAVEVSRERYDGVL